MTKTWLIEASKDGKKWRTVRIAPFETRTEAAEQARQFKAAAELSGGLRLERRFRAVQYVPVARVDVLSALADRLERENAELRKSAIPADAALARGRFA